MNALQARQPLLVALTDWMTRQRQDVIAQIQEENRPLKRRLPGEGTRFTDEERRRSAAKDKVLRGGVLREVASIVASDVILAWHRECVARQWDFSGRQGPGPPGGCCHKVRNSRSACGSRIGRGARPFHSYVQLDSPLVLGGMHVAPSSGMLGAVDD